MEISYSHLVQIALHRDLAQQLLQRTSPGDLAHDLLQRSSQRELAESYLIPLLPETTLTEHHAFTNRVALVLLACSHWCFSVLSTFPFRILTTHCLESLRNNILATIPSIVAADVPKIYSTCWYHMYVYVLIYVYTYTTDWSVLLRSSLPFLMENIATPSTPWPILVICSTGRLDRLI